MKSLLRIILLSLLAIPGFAQQQTLNNGETGLVIRNKINDNFTELYDSVNAHATDIADLSDEIAGLSASGLQYEFSASAPDTTKVWVDTGHEANDCYPIRTYVNGSWTTYDVHTDWWDTIGGVISHGTPWVITYSGQSNVASSFYFPLYSTYGTAYTGDVSLDKNITVWNESEGHFEVYDFTDQSGSTGVGYSSWTSNLGANNLQIMGKLLAKSSGRTVRFIGARLGGTPLAAWEAGQPLYLALVDNINDADVDHVDAFVWIHGEAGLTGASYPTSLFANYRASFNNLIYRLQNYAWTNGDIFTEKTIILAPSHSLAHTDLVVGASVVDGAEGTIRSLDNGENIYTGWVQVPYTRLLQESLAGKSVSTTSINLSTATAPLTLTIGTGLSSYYPVGTIPIAVVSRADNSNYVVGTVSSYTSGTGVLILSPITIYGTGTHTDWDVLPQDNFHWTTLEEEMIGKSMYERFITLPSFRKKETPWTTFQYVNSSGIMTKSYSLLPNNDDTYLWWNSRTAANIASSAFKIMGSAGASLTPTSAIVFKNGTSSGFANSQTDIEIYTSQFGISFAATTDRNVRFAADGNFFYRQVNNSQTADGLSDAVGFVMSNPSGQTVDVGIWRDDDGTGINYKAGSSGAAAAAHLFYHGNTLAMGLYESGLVSGSAGRFELNNKRTKIYNSSTKLSRNVDLNSSLSGSLAAAGTLTADVVVNSNNLNIIPNDSFIEVEVKVVGLQSSATVASNGFSATRKAIFRKTSTTLTYISSGTLEILESSAGIVDATNGITFSVVSNVISATFLRGAATGTYKFSSVVTYNTITN